MIAKGSEADATISQQGISFWFRLGLRYHELNQPENLDRFLILLALFYATNNKVNLAERLYSEAIRKLEKK